MLPPLRVLAVAQPLGEEARVEGIAVVRNPVVVVVGGVVEEPLVVVVLAAELAVVVDPRVEADNARLEEALVSVLANLSGSLFGAVVAVVIVAQADLTLVAEVAAVVRLAVADVAVVLEVPVVCVVEVVVFVAVSVGQKAMSLGEDAPGVSPVAAAAAPPV